MSDGGRTASAARLVVLVLASAAAASGSAAAEAQQRPADAATARAIAAAESEGAAHPRPSEVKPWPLYEIPADIREELDLPPPLELVGTPERTCVPVPRARRVVRSGELVIGGGLEALAAGRRIKLWWQPLADASREMELSVRSRRLGAAAPGEGARFELGPPTASEGYEDEAGVPGAAVFPSAGTWLVTAATGRSWGCFLFTVPPADP